MPVAFEVGPADIEVLGARDGRFELTIARKPQRRLDDIDQIVLSQAQVGLPPARLPRAS